MSPDFVTQGAFEDNAHYRRRLRELLLDGHAVQAAAAGFFAGLAFRSLDRIYDPGTWAACRNKLRRSD